jgi:hypothetical protein
MPVLRQHCVSTPKPCVAPMARSDITGTGAARIQTVGGGATNRSALKLVRLSSLMERTSGAGDLKIGLIDGPVDLDHPDFARARSQSITAGGRCGLSGSAACAHGTFVAGILSARRGSVAPAIAPGCTLLVRSLFASPR